MAARRSVSNPLALAVLACLFERPLHPYEMATTMRERGQERSIRLNYGSLYTVIEQLLRAGFITARETTRAGRRPERTIYELTDAGRAELRDWMAELLSVPVTEYPQFQAALTLLGIMPPSDVARLLAERAERLAAQIGQQRALYTHARAQGVPELFLVELEYRQTMLEAELRFVESLAARVRDEAWDIVPWWRAWHAGEQVSLHPEGARAAGPEPPVADEAD